MLKLMEKQFVEQPKDVEQRKDQHYWYVLLKKTGVAQDVEQPHTVEQPQFLEQPKDVEQVGAGSWQRPGV